MTTDLIDLGIEDQASFELVNTLVSYVMEYILVVNLWRHLIGVRVNSNNAQLICCIGFGTENAFGGGGGCVWKFCVMVFWMSMNDYLFLTTQL